MRKRIERRPISPGTHAAALQAGHTPLQARIIAGRLTGNGLPGGTMRPGIAQLDAPADLPQIDIAAETIADEIESGRVLNISSDHDCDGLAGGSIARSVLIDTFGLPAGRVRSWVGDRIREGYGISDGLAKRLIAGTSPGEIMVTCDCGSSDEPRIALLASEAKLRTIVTDHHELGRDGAPKSAIATVNPVRPDGRFPDRSICGGYTLWLVLAAVRRVLIDRGYPMRSDAHITDCLDYAALSTVADVVDLGASVNNRAVVNYGLGIINNNPRPAWIALREHLKLGDSEPITEETLAWKAAPLANSSGRLSDGFDGLRFLRARTVEDARTHLARLLELNGERRAIQRRLYAAAKPRALELAASGRNGIAIYLPDGHAGCHGITASALVGITGRPVICMSPKHGEPGVATGSIRSVTGVNVREALNMIERSHPGLLLSAGGHAMAGGLRTRKADVCALADAWNDAVTMQLAGRELLPTILTDGSLPRSPDLALVDEIEALAPYGRGFEQPVYDGVFVVESVRAMGTGEHLRLGVRDAYGAALTAVWFSAVEDGQPVPVAAGQRINAAFVPARNVYNGRESLQLRIEHVEPVAA